MPISTGKYDAFEFAFNAQFAMICLGLGANETGMPVDGWNSWSVDYIPKDHERTGDSNDSDELLMPIVGLKSKKFPQQLKEMGLERRETYIACKHPEVFLAWMTPHLEHGEEDAQMLLAKYTLNLAGG